MQHQLEDGGTEPIRTYRSYPCDTEPGITRLINEPISPDISASGSAARLAAWARELRYEDIPATTLNFARSQLISNLATLRATRQHPLGDKFVKAFGPLINDDPKQAAYIMAGMAMCLDFDEVAYSGHLSASCVNTAVAYALSLGLPGRSLLAAIVAANECAARFQAAIVLGPFFQGQSGTHLHLVGAACARLHAENAGLDEWIASLGLALALLPVANHDALLHSDAKAFLAASPVRTALDACDAAAQGFVGWAGILDGPGGVLSQLSAIPTFETLTELLGQRWFTNTLSFKRFPGSAYLQSAFECAQQLHDRVGSIDPARVESIVVEGSVLTTMLTKKVAPFLAGGSTTTSAATFSIGYGVATLLLTGKLEPTDFAAPALSDPSRWWLADKVRVIHNPALTKQMVGATVPLGQALRQAGDRALDWPELLTWRGGLVSKLPPAGQRAIVRRLGSRKLHAQLAELGPPDRSFDHATMAIGSVVTINFTDGSAIVERRSAAIGMAGDATRQIHPDIVREKFVRTGGSLDVVGALESIDSLNAEKTRAALVAALEC